MIPMCSCKHSKDAPNSASRSNWPDIKVPLVMVKKVYSIDSRTASVRLTKNVLRAIKKMCCNVSPIGWCTYLPTYLPTYIHTYIPRYEPINASDKWFKSNVKHFKPKAIQSKQTTNSVYARRVGNEEKFISIFTTRGMCEVWLFCRYSQFIQKLRIAEANLINALVWSLISTLESYYAQFSSHYNHT